MNNQRKILAAFVLVCSVLFLDQSGFAEIPNRPSSPTVFADKFYRTELYFGTDIAGGGRVAAEDWDKFLETVVTPRFPDGFTVLEGFGQYRDRAGKIVREASRLLILFYPKKTRAAADKKIEEIREEYQKRFSQESVLRLDFPKPINVGF